MSRKNDEQQDTKGTERASTQDFLTVHETTVVLLPVEMQGASCQLDMEGHCVTCSDEALPAKILHVDIEAGLALVEVKDTTEEIDITLVESVAPGDMVLVHGGVAISQL